MEKIYTGFLIIMTLLCFSLTASAENYNPEDYCGIIHDSAKSYMKTRNDILYANAKAKILFVTTDSTGGLSTREYTKNLYNEKNLGNYGKNNSILFVISLNNNDYACERGDSIKLMLTDEIIHKFIVDSFEPDFSKKRYTEAVMKLYNSFAGWYEDEYNQLNMNLDDEISNYTYGAITKDEIYKAPRWWMWVGIGTGIIVLLIVIKIKRHIAFKIRQHERRKLKKKFKIDIDKIVNS